MLKSVLGLTCFTLAAAANSAVIDFDTVDSFTAKGRIDRIGDVTFSRDLYTFDDGFEHFEVDGNMIAYNFYGERGTFLSFDSAVTLQSIDFTGQFAGLPEASELVISLLDTSDKLLQSEKLLPAATQTLIFNQSDVSKVEFTFTGGNFAFYGYDRYHAWYTIDNITYSVQAIPIPAAAWLFGSALLGLGLFKRRALRPVTPVHG